MCQTAICRLSSARFSLTTQSSSAFFCLRNEKEIIIVLIFKNSTRVIWDTTEQKQSDCKIENKFVQKSNKLFAVTKPSIPKIRTFADNNTFWQALNVAFWRAVGPESLPMFHLVQNVSDMKPQLYRTRLLPRLSRSLKWTCRELVLFSLCRFLTKFFVKVFAIDDNFVNVVEQVIHGIDWHFERRRFACAVCARSVFALDN